MDKLQIRETRNQLSYAVSCVREAVRRLRRVPDGLFDQDMADQIHALETEIARMQMLKEECQAYLETANQN